MSIEKCVEGATVRQPSSQILGSRAKRHVADDTRQPPRQVGRLLVRAPLWRQGRGAAKLQSRHALEVGVKLIQGTEMGEQFSGGFLADPRHPGNVVDRI